MANEKNLKGVYETLKKEGYTPPAFDEFVKDMQDDKNLQGVHASLKKSGYTPPEYDQFKIDMLGMPEDTPAPAPQPTWQPTEQDKIRMQYELHFGKDEAIEDGKDEYGEIKYKFRHTPGLMEFNERSRKRVEQARRVAERNTPEGRRRLKAAKLQAQLAGTPTQLMGLTPGTTPGMQPLYQEEGQQEQREPLLSGQGPVSHGVKIVNGERKTEWLLPDGSLTTNIADADAAEYGARRVRLMNQFVGRMKENGLNPSKKEDVQRQAQLDYEAPIRKAVAAAVQADDERSDKEQAAYMSNPLNMTGGVNAALGHAAARKDAGIGDLNLIAENAYNSLPSSYRRDLIASYTDYFTRHPEDTNGKTIDQAATDAAKSVVYGQVHEEYVKRNGPQSKNEFFIRKMLELNPASVALSGTINPYGQAYAELDAMERYGAEHRGLDIAGMIAGMAIDPTTYLGGWAGNIAFKNATRAAGKVMAKKALGDVAGRYAATTLAGRIIGGMAAGGANFGTFEAAKDAERQLYQEGYLNPETEEMEGFSFGSVLNSGVYGIGMGAATGVVSPLIGNIADKWVKATSSTGGKLALRAGETAVSKLFEGTIFAAPDVYAIQTMPDEKFDKLYAKKYGYDTIEDEKKKNEARNEARNDMSGDAWSESMAMMMGFGLSHAIKTAPAVIRSLRPVKPTGDRPLSRKERIHNNKSFVERLRERLDHSPSDIAMSDEEREELKRKGYGDLANLFAYDPEHKSRKTDTAQKLEGDYTGITGLSRAVDYESTLEETGNPEFDGYSAMERLMEDESVCEATRAKAYYILTGRMLPMSTVTGWSREDTDDGSIIITSLSNQGGIVTSRRFSGEKEAQGEIDRIQRQSELNTIDIGEQYRNAEAQQRVMAAAINEVSPGADPQTVYNIYEAVRRGDKNVTEEQRIMADMIDEAIERNTDAGAEVSPAGIRERISNETGVDIDKAIRTEPDKRTEAEKDAINRYVRELFLEQEKYEPTEEEAEADRIYEDSRLLYGRFEQGDPDAQAEIDAISLRMTEAYQLCEDAFGDEAEAYMWLIKSDPWMTLDNPKLTSDQKDAVLYYINAKASLDGVLDASNEAAADKRQKVQAEVAHRTHKKRDVIVPATMKADDRPVYIIKGDVAMFPDGSGVDVRNSSDAVIILDESGEYKFTSPDQISTVGETIDPQTELQIAYEAIDREQESIISAATEGVPESDEIVLNSGGSDEMPPETAEKSPESVPNVEEYDRGYEEGTQVATTLDDNTLNTAINDLRGRDFLSDEWRGRLKAYEYEQQRRQMEAQNAPAEVAGNNDTENIPQNGNIGAENIPAPEQQAETALSRIPLDEETQEPRFTAVDPETAWDGLVEAMEGEANALPIAQQMIEDANKRLEALGKKPPTPAKPKLAGKAGPMAMRAEQKRVDEANAKAQAGYQQALDDAQTEAQAWSNILKVYTSRNAELRRQQEEARRQRDEEAHDAAVARFEEEQRIKAEKQAEQESIGIHAVNPKIRERWEVAPKIEGNEDALTLPDGSTITGRYILTEAGAATPSHDVNNAYAPTEGFPIDENGQSVNDRDYQRDKDAQRIVEQIAGSYDNRALQDPVIVSKDGVVLSGNNRTMSGDLAARQGTDKAYIDYLAQYGYKKFGFTPEQVQSMKNPRVAFVPNDDMSYDATTFARFNAREKKAQSKPEAAVKLGKTVPDDIFTSIANDISRYDRLSDFYADEKAVAHALGALLQVNVINDKDMPDLRTGTAISAGGKELIENTLIGKVFQASPDAVRQIISMPSLRESIVMGLSEIASNRTLAKNGYDLSAELANAVDLVHRAKTEQPDIYKEGMPVSPFGRIQGLFEDTRVTDATTLLLADILNSGRPSELRKLLALYNANAQDGASGQYYFAENGDIMPPLSKNEVLTLVNENFRNATPKEQQALIDNAIAERKRRAAEEQRGGSEAGEQTADAPQRGEEPQSLGEPTEAQKAAGNYKMEHRRVDGYNVSIENPKGSVRRGKTVDAEGNETPWETTMQNDYGYIRGTQGVDGDHIDVFLSDTPEQGDVFVIDQLDKDGNFDEHKVMYGFPSEEAAREAYLSNYEPGWTGLGAITHVSKDEFKKWIGSSKRKTKPFADYKSVRDITYNVDQTRTHVNEKGMIVDGEGKPLTLYHGTPNDVEFGDLEPGHAPTGEDEGTRYNGDGISFTPSRMVAAEYASDGRSEGRIFEVNVTLKKPYYTLGVANFTPEEATEFTSSLQAKGYDGIINYPSKAMREGGSLPNEVIVFDIKSATPATAVCPVCGKTGIPNYHSHDVVCPQCNSDLSVFRQIDQLPDEQAPQVLANIEKMEREILGESNKPSTPQPKYDRTVPTTPETQRSAISRIIDFAKRVRNRVERAVIGGITKRQAKDFADNGIEVDETWVHSFESSAVVHNQGRHGDTRTEERAGQIAITHEDYARIPEILEAYDRVTKSPNRSRSTGNEVIIYEKDFEDGYIYYLEEKRDKRKSLSFQTMYKKKKGTDSSDGLMPIASPSTPTAPSDNLSSNSDGKVNTLSADKQAEIAESSEPYTITPAVYVGKSRGGKPGRETPMHRVTFNRPLTAEQERAVKAFANKTIGEKKGRFATKRGWADRESADGSWLFRTEEDARKAGELIGNEEAVADAQPLSAEDYKEASSKPETKPETPKKPIPMNRVDVEGLFNDLSSKGETKLSNHSAPVKPESASAKPESKQKPRLVRDEEMRNLENELRDLLGIDDSEGDRGDLFRNPEDYTTAEKIKIISVGTTYAFKYFDQGIIEFPDFAALMVRSLGEKIRPWIKSFYNGAQSAPGYDHLPFTSADEVKAFDIMNFDKAEKDTDPMRTAQGIVAESRAEAAADEARKEITEQRNQKRKERDEQTTADTEAIAQQAETVASEAEATAEIAVDEQSIAETSEKVDKTLDKINHQLTILGYFERKGKDPVAIAERKAAEAGADLAARLVDELGLNLTDLPKGVNVASADFGDNGGYVRINLPVRKGYEPLRIDIRFDRMDSGSLRLVELTSTLKRGDRQSYIIGTDSKVWLVAPKYGELLETVRGQIEKYLPENAASAVAEGKEKRGAGENERPDAKGRDLNPTSILSTTGDGTKVQISKQMAKANLQGDKDKKPAKKKSIKPEQPVGDLFGSLFDEPAKNEKETELQTRPGTGERAEGHEPRQDEPVGTSQRNEDGGTDGRGMAGRSGGDTGSDSGRGSAVSPIPSEHAVSPAKRDEPLTRLPQKQRRNRNNHVIKRGSEIAPASVDARIRANIEAIETMKRLTSSGADATAENMAKMRAFSGWGGLGKAFSDWNISRRLRQLLGKEAFAEDAQMSRNSAYFTPGYVVDAMWDVAKALGFRGGNVLEGSAGVGNIIGLMPPELSDRSVIQAVEKDTTTGSMLSLLYPDAKVDVQGFEETKIQNGSIDLAITNVPFVPGLRVKDTTGDHDLSKRFKDIHNFCIAKNVRKLRDGGIGIFITTKGTLDSTGGLFNWLNNEGNADIVGLFRLHNETFGGTDATSDIIVVRKRVNGQKSEHAIDASSTTGVRTADYNDGKKTVTRSLSYNRYFVEHPEHMAGEMKFGFETGKTYRPTSIALHPVKGKDQAKMLKAWVKEMSKKTFEEPEAVTEPTNHREEYVPTYDKAGVEVKTGTMQVDSKGRVCVNYDGTLRPLMSDLDKKKPKSEEERIAQFNKNKVKGRTRPQVIADYNGIKKALNELLDYQKNNEGDEGLQKYIDNLNAAYDRFVGYYGHLHRNPSISLLKNDVDYPSVLALETYKEEGIDHTPVFGKADIFRGRVMAKMEQPKPQRIKDGVILSIRQTGDLNIDYIAEALGKPVDEVKNEIIKQGLGYENPTTHIMEPAHLYLSGNVREKLRLAEANNENGRYDANISALRRIVPPTVPSHMIEFSIGSSWLNPQLFNEYIKERTDLNVSMTYAAGTWTMHIDVDSIPEKDKSFGVQSEICNKIIPGHELILAAMTNKTIRVSKSQKDDRIIYDPTATNVCASKVDEIREDFRSWLRGRMQQDEKLAAEIEEKYNDIFNNSAPIEIPNEYVPERFEGAATVVNGKPLKLRPHQSKAVVRGTMQSLMLAHEVGTGKTYTLITTAMEMRRLGTAKKPMIVVQNSTLGQFVASAKALYPDARILSLEDKDRNAQGRKDFYAKIRYNDWDMVVIPQSVLEKIDDHPDRKRKFIEDTIAEKLEVIEQLSDDKDNGRMVANMKKEVEKFRDDLAELHASEEKKKNKDEKKEAIKKANAKIKAEEMLERETDDNLNFDDLGIDAILVDEAHEYKHLGFATAMQRGVKGVDPSSSKKCQGLFLKVKAIQERSGGRNVVFATGTPISNTAAEIWTFMRYLMPKEEMEAYNIWYFDDFVRNFGSIQQMLEYGTSGTYKEVNRFAGYNNLPEMARLWAGIADTVKTDEAGEVKKHIPALEGGQPTDIHLPQTSALRSVLKYVRQRLKEFEEMTGQEKKENSHIPLVIYCIAKAAAVDARLVSASAPDDPHSKTNEAVRQTLRSLKETEKYNGTVAIFADNYQRKNKQTEKVEFNLFEDIKQKLIKNGVPETQIWIMNSGMTAKKKEDIFARVNSGEIRVIMGTTPLLGVGVNIQERLHTLMHLDAPNRPMDYWQRMGRLLRQGNLHKEMNIPVRVLRFGVEDSLDVTAYQRLKTKGAIADAVMNLKTLLSNNLENRVLEEEGDEFGQITAELSGSEYAILQNQTEKELRKLIAKEEQHRQHQTYIYYKIPEYRRRVEAAEMKIANLDKTIALLESLPSDKSISINGRKYKGIDGMEETFKADNKTLGELIERAETLGTSSTHIVKFAIEGKISGDIKREVGQQMVNTMGDMAVYVNTTVSIPGIATDYHLKSRWLKGDINEIFELLNPDKYRRFRENAVNELAEYNRNIETLSKDKGKPFEHTARIAELRELLEEYTEKLQEDLAAKEKKYAEMDKGVTDFDDITFTSEDDEEERGTETGHKDKEPLFRFAETEGDFDMMLERAVSENGYATSGLADKELKTVQLEKHDFSGQRPINQAKEWARRHIAGTHMLADEEGNEIAYEISKRTIDKYLSSSAIDKSDNLGVHLAVLKALPEVIGESVEAEVHPDYLKGYDGKRRPENGYNPDGLVHRFYGAVALSGQIYRVKTTIKEFRNNKLPAIPHSYEVTKVELLPEDNNSKMEPTVSPHTEGVPHGIANLLKNVEKSYEPGKKLIEAPQPDANTMEGAVALLSDKLNTPIRVISRKKAEAEGYRCKKGWYDRETGQITVVADNHRNVGDIADTAMHEAVGHRGLRQLFVTEEKLNNFLDEAYNISNDKIRAEIDRRTSKMMDDEVDRIRERMRKEHEERGENPEEEYYADMAKARVETEKQREQIRRDATEEYASDLGMKIGEEGFERMDAEELTFWGKLKGMLQKALDRLLAGLKLPKMRAWTDKEWSYVLWKSWRNLREGNLRSFFTEAEDIVRREESNFGASESRLFRDGDLGLEEALTKMKADAATANGADFKAKQDAMRAIGGNLSKLRQAMARQREYDITTVKSMTDLYKILLDSGLLDDLSKYETKRILSAIKDAVGREDTSKQVQCLMDIMVDNQLRMGANYFGKLLSVKGSRIDARGIEVQGELDPDGQKIAQTVKKATTRTLDDIDNLMAEAMNRMSSTDQAVADEAALEYAGLQIARQYVEEIRESKNEEKELRKSIDDYKAERNAEAEESKKSIEEARVHKDAGHMTEQDFNLLVHDIEDEERARWAAFKQYAEATNDAIRQNKIERAEAYRSLSEQLGGVLGESIERAKQWRAAEKQRVEDIHHNANSDMKGRPTNEHHKADRLQKFVNNDILRFLLAPLGTFDQMLRMFGRKSVRGEGYLWNRYMRGWVDCTEKEYTGYQAALKTLDKKVSEVFGKNMKWGDLFAMERRMPKASVRFRDGGEMRDHELTQGNLLYIYMVDKMTDGRMKLRHMGITEDDVERIKDFVDPRFIQLADWMQEEFLTEKRNGYNEVHKRMFGTSMAAIENYFPLKILANARVENVDVADDTGDNILPATSTGSIIKRKRNNLALDVTGADAFGVILDHIQQMERWAAFAEYNRDLNTLLSYKRFRNQVMNMTSAYGAGKTLWTNFRNVAALAAGAYRPPIAPLDKAAVNIAKGVTAAKVSFRMFTALKQFLSTPAYISDSNPMYLAANIVKPFKAWTWSMENLPLFEKRWKSRMAGDPRLLKSDMDWKMWRSRIVEVAGRVGMSPNAFVDALTVAIGARSMYQTKLAKYKRYGYTPEQARKRALQDATILFNQTQQSSENAFLSTMQVDRSWLSVLFTVFRNSSMSYTRQLYDAMRNIGHRLRPGFKGISEEFMAKQMIRDGIDPDKAARNAKQEYRRGIIRDLVRIGVFGYALQLAWNLGAYLPYLIFGKNTDEKDKMWDDVINHTMFGSVEGLTGGDVMSAAGEMWMNGEGNPEQLTKDMPLASDVVSILRKMDKDYVSAMNDVVNLLVQSGLGFNPQSLTDAVVAVMDYCGEDAQTSRECALLISRILNCPQSQIDKIYFDEIDATGEEAATMTPEEIAERYAEYKLNRNAPLTGWAYSEEGREEAMEKQRKKARKAMKERMTSPAANDRTRELLESFEEVSEREKELNRLKKTDSEAYRRGREELREGTDMRLHNRVKRYNHDIKRLTEKWMNAKTPQEADSIAGAMMKARERLLIETDSIEAQ